MPDKLWVFFTKISCIQEYSNNKKLPSGMEVEIFNKDLLFDIEKISVDTKNTEYLTFYV